MATPAQIAANRKNAKASTGPKTAEGKARSSRNSINFGLFSTNNCVLAEEQEEYEALSKGLWEDLNPVGIVEQMFATEIIRGAWRLRRCAEMERTLGVFTDRIARRNFAAENHDRPYIMTRDPLFYDYSKDHQIAADRARAQANSTIRRATTELRRLQTERVLRSTFLPAGVANSPFGLASLSDVLPFLDATQRKDMQEGRVMVAQVAPAPASESPEAENTERTQSDIAETERSAATKRTQSAVPCPTDPHTKTAGDTTSAQGTAGSTTPGQQIPRSAPCPCGKGLKYKRCCGKEAPAVLHCAAA
jgi:hypothetical protein